MSFDPNATGTLDSGIFSLPFSIEESRLVLLPVPWEVTTSYGDGTSLGPDAIFECSKQLDLVHKDTGQVYKQGIYWQNKKAKKWLKLNNTMKSLAVKVQDCLEEGQELSSSLKYMLKDLNEQNETFQNEVYEDVKTLIEQNKLVGVVGGDHSSPLGCIRACAEKVAGDYSLIHIDAHADLRNSYQGFTQSHASIMRNVMERDFKPTKLVQIGIRDYCPEEADYIEKNDRIKTFFDVDLKRKLFAGSSWLAICEEIINEAPTKNIYLSIDIDGLSPDFCPSTGTPVPGGIDFNQLNELFFQITKKGKKIIGFDLCEVSPESPEKLDGWDGNVGARVLYNLCCYSLFSNA